MGRFHDVRFPGESDAYRAARADLLAAEVDLRRLIEEVAALRRGLPPGGALKEDYLFDEGAADLSDEESITQTRFSELFEAGKNSLVVYSFMYAAEAETPCPMCTALLDGLDGGAAHIGDRVNLAVVAKAPVQAIRSWARQRGWRHLRLLSSGGNGYNLDYKAESPDGDQLSAFNVFHKTGQAIHHRTGAELFFAPSEPGQHPRHADLIWSLWSVFDLTPEGRGTDWFPKIAYE